MKKVAGIFATIGTCSILFFSSCAKDDNADPDDPATDDASKYKGNWAVAETSKDNGKTTYNVTITDSSNASYMQIAYLYNLSKKTYFTANGSTVDIPNQLNSGLNVKGSGTLENSRRISLKYTVQSTKTHYDTVTAVLTK